MRTEITRLELGPHGASLHKRPEQCRMARDRTPYAASKGSLAVRCVRVARP